MATSSGTSGASQNLHLNPIQKASEKAERLYTHRPLEFDLVEANWEHEDISILKPITVLTI